jgi:crotonobetainyl-CoA:carnitine CoA-transferase CaiB-like acyl-CoA transferase
MSGTLEGVRVVDLSWGIAGPMATGQLADHGASVVRVEPPGGDPYRPFVSHAVYDRGKRSAIADLDTTEGLEIVHGLLADADVVVVSWQPGVAATFGLDYQTLKVRYPRLVVCLLTGYGPTGPDRDRPGYDSLVSARLGAVGGQHGENEPPVYLSVPITSLGTGLLAVIGIMAALLEREDTGEGQEVDTSMLDGALAFMSMFWERLENLEEGPTVRTSPGGPPSRYRLLVATFRCKDGEYLGIHTGAFGSHARLMEAVGLSERVPPAQPGQQEKKEPLTEQGAQILAEEFPLLMASRPRDEWLEILRSADVTAIPLLRQTEAFHDPQVEHNELIVTVDDPELGPVEQVGIPARMADTPGSVRGPAPLAGADLDDILNELAMSAGNPRRED